MNIKICSLSQNPFSIPMHSSFIVFGCLLKVLQIMYDYQRISESHMLSSYSKVLNEIKLGVLETIFCVNMLQKGNSHDLGGVEAFVTVYAMLSRICCEYTSYLDIHFTEWQFFFFSNEFYSVPISSAYYFLCYLYHAYHCWTYQVPSRHFGYCTRKEWRHLCEDSNQLYIVTALSHDGFDDLWKKCLFDICIFYNNI